MGRKLIFKPAEPDLKAQELESKILNQLGLKVGDVVRFRLKEGGHWREGSLVGVNKDTSLRIYDQAKRERAIMSVNCEVKTIGPRGGVTWTQLGEPDVST